MNIRELRQITKDFRDGILKRNDGYSDMMCAVVCYPLHEYLDFLGQKATVERVMLRYTDHVFLRLPDGGVLDPTADQFGDYPKVYIGEPLWFHKEYKHGAPSSIMLTKHKPPSSSPHSQSTQDQ